ncbi:MAG: hypothetical protein FWE24_07310 [Defluviitaleaceae bacterium]|nr:hypothetical protein [Defluviitaleaceae bacterium]
MNINFHYFAIKSLACCAGFCEDKAQQIAKYSQFVDDYSWASHMNCSNIPNEIINSKEFDLFTPSLSGNFSPVTTGFSGPFDYISVIVKREQKFILSPFHFMPFDESKAGIEDERVVPLYFNDNSLIDRFLHSIIDKYHRSEKWNIPLMKLGMLLHIFADTHAHQMFSGFDSWVNKVLVTKVKDNITSKGITGLISDASTGVPTIGHAQVGTLADLSNTSFATAYKLNSKDSYRGSYSQDNTKAFLETARNIYIYLKKCCNNLPLSDNDYSWDELSQKLRQGFLIEYPKKNVIKSLAQHWSTYFPDIKYHYDCKEIKKHFHLAGANTAFTDEFYQYNIMANKLLVALYGPKPRGWESILLD